MWGREKQDIMDNFLKCPFCLSQSVEAKSGKSNCPVCFAEFEIDDRLECIFVDPINLKLPVNGFVCICGKKGSGKRGQGKGGQIFEIDKLITCSLICLNCLFSLRLDFNLALRRARLWLTVL